MIYLRFFSLLFVMLTAACQVTTEQARNKGSRLEGQSNKSAQQLSECIYNRWSTTTVIARDDTSHIEKSDVRTTVFTWEDSMFVDITPQGKGTDYKFYTTFDMGPTVLADRKAIVSQCS
ncbi:hypothetical protein O3W44_03395 [Pantoea sp. LMR881]|uniref:hypothetical protein n=1 Tax=Pantoea sp. LMR881 TaxID=3014336 RepID=UPI0022B07195|nr:hypothetical protein [Pantoea sp. LMR881]MCZ4058335.1 hypothetical protein [Pantoea sp. LMR881]